jgi:isopenicillin N synthase-like dioxygenase
MADASAPLDQVPIIDVGALRSGRRADLDDIARQIGGAARGIGFFGIVNHGVPAAQVASVFEEAARFFALPLAEKRELAVNRTEHYRGYAEIGVEFADDVYAGDLKEAFDVGPDIWPGDPEFGLPFRGTNPWPDLPGFRATLTDYMQTLQALVIDLHRPIAIDLGMEPEYFTPFLDRGISVLRLLRYPPQTGADDGRSFGTAPHTDYGNITLLAQDGTPGLEVCTRSGAWIPVAPTPGTLMCNIGDCLMRWSNDVYASTLHRVINRSVRERYSIAFHGEPNGDARVEALPTCTSVERPAAYPPIDFVDYLRVRITTGYARAHA